MPFIAGFIKTNNPRVLINPKQFTSVERLYDWITGVLNVDDFLLSKEITLPELFLALADHSAIARVNFKGYEVYLIAGEQQTILNSTDRFVHTDFDFPTRLNDQKHNS